MACFGLAAVPETDTQQCPGCTAGRTDANMQSEPLCLCGEGGREVITRPWAPNQATPHTHTHFPHLTRKHTQPTRKHTQGSSDCIFANTHIISTVQVVTHTCALWHKAGPPSAGLPGGDIVMELECNVHCQCHSVLRVANLPGLHGGCLSYYCRGWACHMVWLSPSWQLASQLTFDTNHSH